MASRKRPSVFVHRQTHRAGGTSSLFSPYSEASRLAAGWGTGPPSQRQGQDYTHPAAGHRMHVSGEGEEPEAGREEGLGEGGGSSRKCLALPPWRPPPRTGPFRTETSEQDMAFHAGTPSLRSRGPLCPLYSFWPGKDAVAAPSLRRPAWSHVQQHEITWDTMQWTACRLLLRALCISWLSSCPALAVRPTAVACTPHVLIPASAVFLPRSRCCVLLPLFWFSLVCPRPLFSAPLFRPSALLQRRLDCSGALGSHKANGPRPTYCDTHRPPAVHALPERER